jgi:hypothetical protein
MYVNNIFFKRHAYIKHRRPSTVHITRTMHTTYNTLLYRERPADGGPTWARAELPFEAGQPTSARPRVGPHWLTTRRRFGQCF